MHMLSSALVTHKQTRTHWCTIHTYSQSVSYYYICMDAHRAQTLKHAFTHVLYSNRRISNFFACVGDLNGDFSSCDRNERNWYRYSPMQKRSWLTSRHSKRLLLLFLPPYPLHLLNPLLLLLLLPCPLLFCFLLRRRHLLCRLVLVRHRRRTFILLRPCLRPLHLLLFRPFLLFFLRLPRFLF